MLHLVLNKNLS